MTFITTISILFWSLACTVDPEKIPNSQLDGGNDYPSLPSLDTLITEEMADAKVPGLSACITRGEETIWCNGYGYANIETEQLATHTTPFMLASISKTFIAVAAMHLQENSGFSIDDPINSILGFTVEHPDDNTAITTKMLLSHAAGIDDNWGVMNDLYADGDSPIALGDFLQDYLHVDGQYYNANRNFVNGGVNQNYEYSNIGSSLAAYIVEVASGVPFDSYCEQNIFTPLGMQDTAWHLAGLDENIVAMPYEWNLNDWEAFGHFGYPDYPDGQLRTGAEQLATFLAMFHNGGEVQGTRIVSAESVSQMNTAHFPDLDSSQGLSWYWWNINGDSFTGHNGGDVGTSTEMGVREDGVGFVVLMNGDGDNQILPNIEEAMIDAAQEIE
jgi:CubicO group peptidase (beta-lactamase class C family)